MNRHGTDPTPSPDQALLILRMIGASLGLGVTAFALVSWFAHRQGALVAPPGDPMLMFNLMLALALASAIAAMALWRARVAPLLEEREPGEDPVARLGRIQTSLIIVWAIAEGAALVAVAVHYLFGLPLAGALGLVLIWGVLAATWPKREWLGGGSARNGNGPIP